MHALNIMNVVNDVSDIIHNDCVKKGMRERATKDFLIIPRKSPQNELISTCKSFLHVYLCLLLFPNVNS